MRFREGLLAVLLLGLAQALPAAEITYQGQLRKNSGVLTSTCTFGFTLWDLPGSGSPPTGGNQIGGSLFLSNVIVTGGLFTVGIDAAAFGASALTGPARWLQVGVQCTGDGSQTILAPRQPLGATPFAFSAENDWSLFGVSGTNAATNFLGTSDAQPLVFKTNGAERMRLTETGRLGISVTVPGALLDVTTNSSIPGLNASTMSSGSAIQSMTSSAGPAIDASSSSAGHAIHAVATGVGRAINATGIVDVTGLVSVAGDVTATDTVTAGGSTYGFTSLHAVSSINGNATATASHVAFIENASTGSSPDVLALKVATNANPTTSSNFITFFRGGDVAVGTIEGNGAGGIQLTSGAADYAEWLPRAGRTETIAPGDIVGIAGGGVSKKTRGAAHVMVASTGPIVAGNDPGKDARDGQVPVAFLGQVVVRVRGDVHAGDLILPSGEEDGSGAAIAPDKIDPEEFQEIVGQAWNDAPGRGLHEVRIAVGLAQHDPTVQRLAEREKMWREKVLALEERVNALEGILSASLPRGGAAPPTAAVSGP
ncbi:MAG TPA: hypothetical protein VKF32_06455 [Thermoanaerobaculia bacterium]|nr:hypothetical protein [Thermoanaerobaculia bacterium]